MVLLGICTRKTFSDHPPPPPPPSSLHICECLGPNLCAESESQQGFFKTCFHISAFFCFQVNYYIQKLIVMAISCAGMNVGLHIKFTMRFGCLSLPQSSRYFNLGVHGMGKDLNEILEPLFLNGLKNYSSLENKSTIEGIVNEHDVEPIKIKVKSCSFV